MHLDMDKLIKLQSLDASIKDLDAFVSVPPVDLLEKEDRLKGLLDSLSSLDILLKESNTELVAVKANLESSQSMHDSAHSKKGNVNNSKEYEAALREIDTLGETILKLEARKEELDTVVESTSKELSTFDDEKGKLQSEVDSSRISYESSIASSRERLAALNKEHNAFIVDIPKQILSKYNRLKSKYGDSVVALQDTFCSGCSMQLTPQSIVEIKRSNAVTKCMNCGRYLYDSAS